jgi:hypothetical protein
MYAIGKPWLKDQAMGGERSENMEAFVSSWLLTLGRLTLVPVATQTDGGP